MLVEKLSTKKPSYEEFNELLGDTIRLLENERHKYKNSLVFLAERYPLIVVGDLHGDIATLSDILKSVEAYVGSSNEWYIAFLGDYVDRGSNQIEVLSTLLSLKLAYPDNILLLRGNHEPPRGLEPYPHDFPLVLSSIYGGNAPKLYEKTRILFDNLPYAAVFADKILLVHGGIPVERTLRETSLARILGSTSWPPSLDLLEEVLWNDPTDDIEDWTYSPRGAGRLWGPRITMIFLEKTGLELIVRGHEPAFHGFKANHDGRVLTLFSMLRGPYGNKSAGYMVVENKDCISVYKAINCVKRIP